MTLSARHHFRAVTSLGGLSLLLAVLLAVAVPGVQAQDETEKEKTVSNDDPARPLQMPPAPTEVREAFADFERFQRRGAWERAFKAIANITPEQAKRFIDGENGFIISVATKRRNILSALGPEGRAAYQLYHDAEAKKLFEEAVQSSVALAKLEQVFSAEFVTSVGDNAGDRLGDLYFEQGRFDRAADCWLAVLREHPDTDLAPAQVAVKAAWALVRAGRRGEFDKLREEIADRYADEQVTIGGQSQTAGELVAKLAGDLASPKAEKSSEVPRPEVHLTEGTEPAWQMRFAAAVEAGMTPSELQQWESNPLRNAVPNIAIDQGKMFVNYVGFFFAIDIQTGKLLWRSEPFHQLDNTARQSYARYADPMEYEIIAGAGRLWCLSRKLTEPYTSPFRMTCHLADSGDVVWSSSDLSDYSKLDLVGRPLFVGDRLFVAAKSKESQPQQLVLAIRPHDGKLLWQTEVGKFRSGNRYYYYSYREKEAQPRFAYEKGTLFLETHQGILARLDADSGELSWGLGYQTAKTESSSGIFFFGYEEQAPESQAISDVVRLDETLLVKGMKSKRLIALAPGEQKVLWERPISSGTRVLAADQRTLYLGGDELGALDLRTRELIWATRLPGDSKTGKVLVLPGGIWQFTPRGIFEVDPQTGRVRNIFRGHDLGAAAGSLHLTDQLLISVSNQSITAYPRHSSSEVAVTSTPPTSKKAPND